MKKHFEFEGIGIQFLQKCLSIGMKSDLFTTLPHHFETILTSITSGVHEVAFYSYNEDKKRLESKLMDTNDSVSNSNGNDVIPVGSGNSLSSSPIAAAWNNRQLIKFDSETNIGGNVKYISTICTPIKHDGLVLGIIKLIFHHQKKYVHDSHEKDKKLQNLIKVMSNYCAPIVFLTLWRSNTLKDVSSREKQVKNYEKDISAAFNSAKLTNQRLEKEKEELYKELEITNEILETTKFELLSTQKQLARLERDNELLETKIEEAPSTNINEDVLRITNEYQTLKRKYRTQSARFERVVNLLKAYPQYEAPIGYDALDMLSSTIGSSSSSSRKKKMMMKVVVTPNIKK